MISNSLRHGLQVEGTEERRVLDLLPRPSPCGGGRVAAGGLTAGPPLNPTLRAPPRESRTGRTRTLTLTDPCSWVRSILYGTVAKNKRKLY